MDKRPPRNSSEFSCCLGSLLFAFSFLLPIVTFYGYKYFEKMERENSQTNTSANATKNTHANTNSHGNTSRNTHKRSKGPCGEAGSCYKAGMRHYEAGNYSEADLLLDFSCQNGVVKSCMVQGLMALEGKIGPASPENAARYFKTACDREYGEACYYLADTLSRINEGAGKAPADVNNLWQKACYLGSADSCLRYGEILMKTGPDQEIYKVLSYMDQACSIDSKGEACKKAGSLREELMIRQGSDNNASALAKKRARRNASAVPKTPEELRTACADEDAEACYRLGFYYEHAPELSPQERRDRALLIYGELCQKRDPQGCEGFRRIKNAFAR